MYRLQWNEVLQYVFPQYPHSYEISNYIHRNGEIGTRSFSAATAWARDICNSMVWTVIRVFNLCIYQPKQWS
jgi:hypothetical protein